MSDWFSRHTPFRTPKRSEAVPHSVSDELLAQILRGEQIVGDPDLLAAGTSRVWTEPHFSRQLWGLVERSKKDPSDAAEKAASAAISLLVASGTDMSGKNLRGIRVPEAILIGAKWDKADLRGADLRGVDLGGASLKGARFDGANLEGAIFAGECYEQLACPRGSVQGLAFHPNGQWLATVSSTGEVGVLDLPTGTPLEWKASTNLRPGSVGLTLRFSPDGNDLALVGTDRQGRKASVLCDALLSSKTQYPSLVGEDFDSIAFLPEGTALVLSHTGQRCTVRNMRSGAEVGVFNFAASPAGKPQYFLQAVVFSNDARTLAMSSHDGETCCIALVETSTGKNLLRVRASGMKVDRLVFSQNDQRIAFWGTSEGGRLGIWDIGSDNPPRVFETNSGQVSCVAFSPDEKLLAYACRDGKISLWNAKLVRCLGTFRGHSAPVNCVAFSQNGEALASSGEDQTVMLRHVGRHADLLQGQPSLDASGADIRGAVGLDRWGGFVFAARGAGSYPHAIDKRPLAAPQ